MPTFIYGKKLKTKTSPLQFSKTIGVFLPFPGQQF